MPSDDEADVVAHLRSHALSVAATGYTAAHGHPLDHATPDAAPIRWRWLLGHRGAVVLGLALALIVAVVLLRTTARMPTTALPVQDPQASLVESALGEEGQATAGAAGPAPSTTAVVVHMAGQVHSPGLVQLAPGARVADAITAAGGETGEADLAAVNLARVVVDGEQIYLPAVGEVPRDGGGAPRSASGVGSSLVDLNGADLASLDTLPGIGPVLAGRIVDWREQHGRFTSVEELGEVEGIGPTLLGRLRDLVRV